MQADLINPIITLVSVLAAFVWLRHDIKSQGAEIQKLRDDMNSEFQKQREDRELEFQKLRDEMKSDNQRLEGKIDNLDLRLRAVESEQSRVAGLLEGLALAGALPDRES